WGFRSFPMAIPLWLKEKLFQKELLRDELRAFDSDFDWESRLLFAEHHQSHAASAFFPSPFDPSVLPSQSLSGKLTNRDNFPRAETCSRLPSAERLALCLAGIRSNSPRQPALGLRPSGYSSLEKRDRAEQRSRSSSRPWRWRE